MNGETERQPDCDFAGINTWLLVRYLRDQMGSGAVERVLAEAGETRSPDELLDAGTWTSYAQFRALLEVTARTFGGASVLASAAGGGLDDPTMPELTAMLQSLGSPEALLGMITQSGGASLAPIIGLDGQAVGPTEWVVREWFSPGFSPFREYCAWAAGLYSNIPMLFGMRAEVVEEECACDGAPVCVFRVRWFPDDATASADSLEARNHVLSARLEALQQTVGDLVSDADLERVLDRIVVSASRAVYAPVFVLALESLPSAARHVYATGATDAEAERLAGELLSVGSDRDDHHLVVEVVSTRRRYGLLAAVSPSTRFFPQERVVLQAYARLAAAALDSAAALEAARHQTQTARALLGLSNALAEIVATDEMAANIASAVPAVIGCDRAAVILFEPNSTAGRIVATSGYSSAVDLRLRSLDIPAPRAAMVGAEVTVWDRSSAHASPLLAHLMAELEAVAVAAVPMFDNGEYLGLVVGDVFENPERLRDPELPERLRGLASQATIAIRNARLLEGMRHQALHDSLTGLPNRTLILDRAEQMLARSRRTHTECAALFVDLDGFKRVNDTLGHDAGDRLLKAVAARLAATLRAGDTIARLGGDEFVVLVEDGSNGSPELVADRLLEVLRLPFEIEEMARDSLRITASVGIALGRGREANDLLRDADIALYEAKAAGRDRSVTFRREMQTAVEDRVTLEIDLRAAIERGEFFLVYQPIFELGTGEVRGVEALLRWNHPTRGIVPPNDFIPLLEETKLIVEVGRWVLGEACRQAREWELPDRTMYMSVNVSARQLDDDRLRDDIRDTLATSGLDSASLVIEVTETAIMHDAEATARELRAIKELGVGVAIDDFGTGYSSLNYLRQFPVDILKIDRSFVNAISESPESKALIRTLVQLGKQLGLKTLAEGIEQHEQFCYLQQEHCDTGQGYMFARPLAADAVIAFLDELPVRDAVVVEMRPH